MYKHNNNLIFETVKLQKIFESHSIDFLRITHSWIVIFTNFDLGKIFIVFFSKSKLKFF